MTPNILSARKFLWKHTSNLSIHRSVNIPWPEKGMGDAEYLHAFMKIVMPIAMEFAPDLVMSE